MEATANSAGAWGSDLVKHWSLLCISEFSVLGTDEQKKIYSHCPSRPSQLSLAFHSNSLQTGLPASAHPLRSSLSRAARGGLLKCQSDYATQTFRRIQVQNPNCGPRGSSGYEPRIPLSPHLLPFPAAHLALSSFIPSLESRPLEYDHEDRTLPCVLLNLQCWHLTNICE